MTDEEKMELAIKARSLFEHWIAENEEGRRLAKACKGENLKHLDRAFAYGFLGGCIAWEAVGFESELKSL